MVLQPIPVTSWARLKFYVQTFLYNYLFDISTDISTERIILGQYTTLFCRRLKQLAE